MKADRILLSEAVFTGNTLEPLAGGVAIAGDRVLAVGSKDEVLALAGPDAEVVDYGEQLIAPGFNDSHQHFASAAAYDDPDFCINLMGCTSEQECADRVRGFCEAHPDNEWVYGLGWDTAIWDDHTPPSRETLDCFAPDQPICLSSFDHHAVWANGAALAKAGITAETPQPEGGEIVKDETGRPTGLLLGQPASMQVSNMALHVKGLKGSILRMLDRYRELGITAVGDMFPRDLSNDDIYDTYREIEEDGDLTCRITFFPSLLEVPQALEMRTTLVSDRLRVGGVKQVLDGVIEAQTAFMLEPYEGTDHRGETNLPADEFKELVCAADAAGLAVRVHCIGDASARLALDALKGALRENGRKELHHCLEHIETIADEDIERMAALGVGASVQPLHATFGSSMGFYDMCIGADRASRCWRFRTVRDAGIPLSLSTDFPAAPMVEPLQVLYAAVARSMPDGEPAEGLHREYALTLGEALQCMTQGSAWVESFDHELGTLAPGKLADLVVIDRNLFAVDDLHEIAEASVVETIVGGETVFVR